MFVCGIDVSSFAVDCVLLDVDDVLPPEWKRYELHGADAWERTRDVPRFGEWVEDVVAFGVENPQARGPAAQNIAVLHRVVGAVLVHLPRRTLVHPWQPASWRKACGIPGNASKGLVKSEAIMHAIGRWGRVIDEGPPIRRVYPAWVDLWPQDAWDAYCLARATAGAYRMIEAEERDGSVSV